jgi:hypothetical protein
MDLYRSALSLVIHKKGSVGEADVDDVISRYRRKRSIVIDKPSYLLALEAALAHYSEQKVCLFVCNEGVCAEKAFVGDAGPSLANLSEQLQCTVEETGCHWQCEGAPVLTLKVDGELISFSHCVSEESLSEALGQIRARLSALTELGS